MRHGNCYIPDVSHRFKPNVSETFFMSRIQTIENQKHFSSKKLEFTIDFFPAKHKDKIGRLTMDLQNGKYLKTLKEDKSSVDVMHQGLCYRIGVANEIVQDLTRKEFHDLVNRYGIGFSRVKIRRSFTFQYMEFSFTKTYEISDRVKLNEMLYIAKIDVPEDLEELKSKCLVFMEMDGSTMNHEVELEIIDINYLKNLLDKDYFGFCKVVERFMRNAEGLFSFPDEFHLEDYKQMFGEDNIEYPIIGEYMNEISKDKLSK